MIRADVFTAAHAFAQEGPAATQAACGRLKRKRKKVQRVKG